MAKKLSDHRCLTTQAAGFPSDQLALWCWLVSGHAPLAPANPAEPGRCFVQHCGNSWKLTVFPLGNYICLPLFPYLAQFESCVKDTFFYWILWSLNPICSLLFYWTWNWCFLELAVFASEGEGTIEDHLRLWVSGSSKFGRETTHTELQHVTPVYIWYHGYDSSSYPLNF